MIFRYKVVFYDNSDLIESIGLVSGETYQFAIEKVIQNFDEESIDSVYLEYLCTNGENLEYSDNIENYRYISDLLTKLKDIKN